MVKEGYKETELGLIPEDWNCVLLNNILQVGHGKNQSEIEDSSGEYPILATSGVIGYTNNYLWDKPSALIGRKGTINKPQYIDIPFWTIDTLFYTKINDGTCPKFVYYLFCTVDWTKMNEASGVPSLSSHNIEHLKVAIPSLQEQRRIAEALSDIDSLISSLEKLIEKKKAIKQACLQKMFPKDGENVPEMRLPGFTKPWEQRKLSEITSLITKGTTPLDKSGIGEINFIKVENLNTISGEIISCSKITKAEHEIYLKRSQLKENDILFSIAGTLGRVGIVESSILPANTNQALSIIRLKEGYLRYVSTVLMGRTVEDFIRRNPTIGAQPNLSLEQVGNLEIPYPQANEQRAIGDFFSNLDNLITLHQRKLEKCKKIKQGMMQQLLTGKIRLTDSFDNHTEVENKKTVLTKQPSKHNQKFDDAVVIAAVVDKFYSDKYPLGRKKIQKLLYLLRRHQEVDVSAFKKKAAGPYADDVRYKGGEGIAIKNKYIVVQTGKKGSKFKKGEKISNALGYVDKWNLTSDLQWLMQFKYTTVDDLELYATVDMAICDLKSEGKEPSLRNIKMLIKSNKEWEAKLSKPYFTDKKIGDAIEKCKVLFG